MFYSIIAMTAFGGLAEISEWLILGVLNLSPNATDSLKIKTQHPCRQTRVSKNETLKVLRAIDFIFQINSIRHRAHKKVDSPRGLPPEGRPK